MRSRSTKRRSCAASQHLAPYFALLALLGVMFKLYGLGSIGSGGYHDPGREPVAYALSLVQHLPVLLSAELGLPLADVWFWGPVEMHAPIWALSVFTVVLLAGVGHVLLARDREARFWMMGMVISGCAVSASVPGERLLLVPSLGAAVFLAKLIHALWPMAYARKPLPWLLAVRAVHVHFGGRPLMFPVRAQAMGEIHDAIERADAGIPTTPEIRDQTVVIVNAPFDLMVSYLQLDARSAARAAAAASVLARLRELGADGADARRLDAAHAARRAVSCSRPPNVTIAATRPRSCRHARRAERDDRAGPGRRPRISAPPPPTFTSPPR